MRHSRQQILARVTASPSRVFAMVLEDQIVGAIYTQRISSVATIDEVTWTSEDQLYDMNGQVLQLLRVNTWVKSQPAVTAGLSVGGVLRDFCLHYAHELGLSVVCAVTRTRDYTPNMPTQYEAYVRRLNSRGQSPDQGLNFHVARGAVVVKAVESWRPEDPTNEGFGVLIEYDLTQVGPCVHSFALARSSLTSRVDRCSMRHRINPQLHLCHLSILGEEGRHPERNWKDGSSKSWQKGWGSSEKQVQKGLLRRHHSVRTHR